MPSDLVQIYRSEAAQRVKQHLAQGRGVLIIAATGFGGVMLVEALAQQHDVLTPGSLGYDGFPFAGVEAGAHLRPFGVSRGCLGGFLLAAFRAPTPKPLLCHVEAVWRPTGVPRGDLLEMISESQAITGWPNVLPQPIQVVALGIQDPLDAQSLLVEWEVDLATMIEEGF